MDNYMNQFLKELFDIIAIDTEHLNLYLTSSQKQYLNNNLKSKKDLNSTLYTSEEGENLEMLLHFLVCHADDIALILKDNSKKEILLKLYTSTTISGNYECFHFDLSKFDQTYKSKDQILTLYRVGRKKECEHSLGNSWAKDFAGLKNYTLSSSIDADTRPVFVIKINDSEVLCEGKYQESELILKKNFKLNEIKLLDAEEKHKVFV